MATEMEISSPFPWEHLPVSLQESILLRLPISALLRCTAASRSLRSLIRSPSFISSYKNPTPQPLFLFSADPSAVADAYDPLLDHWTSFSFPLGTTSVRASDDNLLLLHSATTGSVAYDPFSNLINSDVINILNNDDSDFYPITLITEWMQWFKIAIISDVGRLFSLLYDSSVGAWDIAGVLEHRYALITNMVLFNGMLHCLTRGPDHLLAFKLDGRRPEVLDVSLPATRCLQVLVFNGKLMLVGGVEEVGAIVRVGIWEMHWGKMECGAYCFMPVDVFTRFSEGGINYFQMVDRKGMACFVAKKRDGGSSILMCDLAVKRWWWPSECGRRNTGMSYCSVHAVEPYVDLVRY